MVGGSCRYSQFGVAVAGVKALITEYGANAEAAVAGAGGCGGVEPAGTLSVGVAGAEADTLTTEAEAAAMGARAIVGAAGWAGALTGGVG